MKLAEPLIPGRLLRRYKRFLADVVLEDDSTVTVHCPNSGSMMGLLGAGNPVLLSRSANARRKLPYTWELVRVERTWVGVNTLIPNRLVDEALRQGSIRELSRYSGIKREAVWAAGRRLDFRLHEGEEVCFLEVKNVTLAEGEVALFPDAKTERGLKHLHALMAVVRSGYRAAMLFVVNREDCTRFMPAAEIDPDYSAALREAHTAGVEILTYRSVIRPPRVELGPALPFALA